VCCFYPCVVGVLFLSMCSWCVVFLYRVFHCNQPKRQFKNLRMNSSHVYFFGSEQIGLKSRLCLKNNVGIRRRHLQPACLASGSSWVRQKPCESGGCCPGSAGLKLNESNKKMTELTWDQHPLSSSYSSYLDQHMYRNWCVASNTCTASDVSLVRDFCC